MFTFLAVSPFLFFHIRGYKVRIYAAITREYSPFAERFDGDEKNHHNDNSTKSFRNYGLHLVKFTTRVG